MRERQLVAKQLAKSEARLLSLVGGLTTSQWSFREGEGRWTIAEVVEHLIVFEGFITHSVTNALRGTAEPEKTSAAGEKQKLVLGLATSREKKLRSREANLPTGRWVDGPELIAKFREARAGTIAFVTKTEGDLRRHFFPHIAFGDLDCYQWLVLLSQHTLRHCLQVDEVTRNLRFPVQ